MTLKIVYSEKIIIFRSAALALSVAENKVFVSLNCTCNLSSNFHPIQKCLCSQLDADQDLFTYYHVYFSCFDRLLSPLPFHSEKQWLFILKRKKNFKALKMNWGPNPFIWISCTPIGALHLEYTVCFMCMLSFGRWRASCFSFFHKIPRF